MSWGGLWSYQPERSKDGKTADIGHAKFEEGEGDDDEIKDVPTLLWEGNEIINPPVRRKRNYKPSCEKEKKL